MKHFITIKDTLHNTPSKCCHWFEYIYPLFPGNVYFIIVNFLKKFLTFTLFFDHPLYTLPQAPMDLNPSTTDYVPILSSQMKSCSVSSHIWLCSLTSSMLLQIIEINTFLHYIMFFHVTIPQFASLLLLVADILLSCIQFRAYNLQIKLSTFLSKPFIDHLFSFFLYI